MSILKMAHSEYATYRSDGSALVFPSTTWSLPHCQTLRVPNTLSLRSPRQAGWPLRGPPNRASINCINRIP